MNTVVISGKIPKWNGTYTAAGKNASGKDVPSMMKWQLNVQLPTKNSKGYNDEALLNFTAWGYYADLLNEFDQLPLDSADRNVSVVISGRLDVAYVNKDGVIVYGFNKKDGSIGSTVSVNATEVQIYQKRFSSKPNDGTNTTNAIGTSNTNLPKGTNGVPRKAGVPGVPGGPGVPPRPNNLSKRPGVF